MKIQEGFIGPENHRTWYSICGELSSEVTPLLVLHGGPGYPHYHLQPLDKLANEGQPVIFYDQLGCGKSDRPDNPKLWTIDHFVDELQTVRDTLGLERVSLLGHSWGGTLALEYMFTKPAGVEKLILSSPLLDTQLWIEETGKLIDALPPNTAATIRKHEAAGTTDSPVYQAAYYEFVTNFVCRIVPQPKILDQADEEWSKQVYETMWGPSESCATGILKNYSCLNKLGTIAIPTLLLSGKYDEATPRQIELAHKRIPDAQWVLLQESSHAACFEQTEAYLAAIKRFLTAD